MNYCLFYAYVNVQITLLVSTRKTVSNVNKNRVANVNGFSLCKMVEQLKNYES